MGCRVYELLIFFSLLAKFLLLVFHVNERVPFRAYPILPNDTFVFC